MKEYQQSQNLAEIQAKHPFPWREQRMGPFVRMVDANNVEVILFEITALASIITTTIATQQQKKEQQA